MGRKKSVDVDRIIYLRQKGFSFREIAEKLGISYHPAWKYAKHLKKVVRYE